MDDEDSKLGSSAVLRTTAGDVHVKLFPAETPRTIEKFCGHARSGYYDNVIFHRVIPGFMIQTGDPLGDGTGGESIWGGRIRGRDLTGFASRSAVYGLLGQCGTREEWIAILYHDGSNAVVGWKAHRLWKGNEGNGHLFGH